MSTYTPGPWMPHIVNAGHADPSVTALGIVGGDNTIVARMPAEYKPTHAIWGQCEADARLIAAAPELLEALVMLTERYDFQEDDQAQAIAAIRKARGEV